MSQTARNKFAGEYPTLPNPIGRRVVTARDPKFDGRYASPDERTSAPGKIVDYSNSHGLCFRVMHDDGCTAWYEPCEVKSL